ncbi:MAG: GNAT family N-acetyltransferase [Pirellulaceae bacterium]
MTRQIDELNSIDDVVALAPEWERLLDVTPRANFFQSWQWLAARWRHVTPSHQLRVFVVRDGGEVTGILPMCVQHERTNLGWQRVLTVPTDGWGSFYGPIGTDALGIVQSVMAYLRRQRPDYDLMELRFLPLAEPAPYSGSDMWGPAVPALLLDGLTFQSHARAGQIVLDSDWQAYWDSRRRDANRRRNVERCERRLSELGRIDYVRYRPGGAGVGESDPRWDYYDACEELSRRSWQAGLQDGNTLCHLQVRDLLRDVHVAAVEAGALDMNLLYLNGDLVAFMYGYHYRGHVDMMRIGFEPEHAKVAPGNALWTRAIRDSFERGDHVLDLGPTCLDYKKFWITHTAANYTLTEYPISARSQALRLARWLRKRWKKSNDLTNHDSKQRVKQVGQMVDV